MVYVYRTSASDACTNFVLEWMRRGPTERDCIPLHTRPLYASVYALKRLVSDRPRERVRN